MRERGGPLGGIKYPTLRDVARLAGTSIATVSHVLNETKGRYVTAELRTKVLSAANKLNYSKSLVASGLKGKSRQLLTLLIPNISNAFYAQVALAIEQYAFKEGYIVHICNTLDDPQREGAIIEQAVSQRVDGLFISGTASSYENTRKLRDYGIPCVAIERHMKPRDGEEPYVFVGSNLYQSGNLAGEYLLRKGHRRFAYVEWFSANLIGRRQGFEAAVKPSLGAGSYLVKSTETLAVEEGYRLTQRLLDETDRPSAFLYGHHVLAKGGMKCLQDAGINVPRDISVLIIGASLWLEESPPPKPAFVCQPASRIGVEAARRLIRMIGQGGQDLPAEMRRAEIDCDLIEGDTVRDLTAGAPSP